jgi:hypothetical protein
MRLYKRFREVWGKLPRNVKIGNIVAGSGISLAVLSIIVHCLPLHARQPFLVFNFLVLSLWLVGPPIWFIIESAILVDNRFDASLKLNQDLYAKLWVGVSTLLGALAALHHQWG